MKHNNYSFLDSQTPSTIQKIYEQYLKDSTSVDSSWVTFFQGFEFALEQQSDDVREQEGGSKCQISKEFRVSELIHAYRQRGHLFTATNPVRKRRKYFPTLDIEEFGLSEDDWDNSFVAGTQIGIGKATLRTIVAHLQETYCKSVGVEYLYMREPVVITWLQAYMEGAKNQRSFSHEEKEMMYDLLTRSTGFEQFIHIRFAGQKRFSLEGAEVLIPALHALVRQGAREGVRECILGMAHRGRLNVLTHVLEKPMKDVFKEFEGAEYEEGIALGDVKYHLGYGRDCKTMDGLNMRINLLPNPSHLEAVLPVVQGLSRAKIESQYEGDYDCLVPVVIHGDAAVAGQGVVYETIQMSLLEAYKTGGTIHIVINNQVGFTTDYLESRSSTYCTDIAKVTRSPVFHVNGDDVEAVAYTMELAMSFRQRYHTDVFVDILCYRRYGHNEGDEPRFTQPVLYKNIAKHPNCRDVYGTQLMQENIFSEAQLLEKQRHYKESMEKALLEARKDHVLAIRPFLPSTWQAYRHAKPEDFAEEPDTSITEEGVVNLTKALNTLPQGVVFYNKVNRIVSERLKLLAKGELDWGMAELLAYAALLKEGKAVRLSGQDSVRGTFGHRHAAFTIDNSDERYSLLENLPERKAEVGVYNSSLSEYGVMGFEYGFALGKPDGLTIWEAQFGDFYNVAQVIIDQYIVSAEEKWGLRNGLVLYLPHGFEGQGPEHSSARIERFLSMSRNHNIQVCNCTLPANFFHLLRRQVLRDFRLPLVIFTPKSLLRHPLCRSSVSDFSHGSTFQAVIDDPNKHPEEVRRLVFCSGKVYYDLLARQTELGADDVALVRLEQLHPFPRIQIEAILKKYDHSLLHLWVQEEPLNMGPWLYIQNMWERYFLSKMDIVPLGRQEAGSPATGLKTLHERGQEEILAKVFKVCTCPKQLKYCGLQCVEGRSREEILKQHHYFEGESLFSND